MLKNLGNKKTVFVLQVTEQAIKIAKCLNTGKAGKQISELIALNITSDSNEEGIAHKIADELKKLGYNSNPIIISLPRSKTTCRFLNVPTQLPHEIENIVSLQAARYLPYSAEELVTGYQSLYLGKDGYAQINLIIAHRDVLTRYVKIFKDLKASSISVALSSYGLVNLYDYLNKPAQTNCIIIIDIDGNQAELVVALGKKVLFSRYFKINRAHPDWENLFLEEVKRTLDAYVKEVGRDSPDKIIVTGSDNLALLYHKILQKQPILPAQILSYAKAVKSQEASATNAALSSDNSFASLIGLGLESLPDSLNLLPQDLKEQAKNILQAKRQIRNFAFAVLVLILLAAGIAKNLSNKSLYIKRLKSELSKIEKEARPLEEMEKKLVFMQNRLAQKPSGLEVFFELHQLTPSQVSLAAFNFEEDKQLILRGQSLELNSVFSLVSYLEKSSVFKKFSIKVRYASKRKTAAGEIIEFEIVCLREK